MDEEQESRNDLISIDTAIKYAQVSVYALQHTANGVTSKNIKDEMLMHYRRYNEKMVSLLLKGYEQEEKKK